MTEPEVKIRGFVVEQIATGRHRLRCTRCASTWTFTGRAFTRIAAPAVAKSHDRRHHQ